MGDSSSSESSLLFSYAEEENIEKPLGKKLGEMGTLKFSPKELWEPRVRILDSSSTEFLLNAIQDPKAHKDIAFPVKVMWCWLSPENFPQVQWRDVIWWKVMGLFANHELREYSMRFHARMQRLNRKVRRLNRKYHITDQERSDDMSLEMAIDALMDLEQLISLGLQCDFQSRTIGEVAEAAGCPWRAFLEPYMEHRNNALTCDSSHRCRELINAAARGTDGLELLFQQLVHKIDMNDLLPFKLLIGFLNITTLAAQFAWSDYVVPLVHVPIWQKQIAKMHTTSNGG